MQSNKYFHYLLILLLPSFIFGACNVIDIEYTNPVTDFTGKTIYTKRILHKECSTIEQHQIGCNQWQITTTDGVLDYNINGVGTIFKQQDGSGEASQNMAMLEEQFHIFSGWEGYCDNGTLFDNPFEDPMKLLSYGMMVYGAAVSDEGSGVAAIDAACQEVDSLLDNAASVTQQAFSDVKEAIASSLESSLTDAELVAKATADLGLGATENLNDYLEITQKVNDVVAATTDAESLVEQIMELDTIAIDGLDLTIDMPWGTVMEFYYSDVLELGMAMMPTEKDLQTAKDFNLAWMGNQSSDVNSIAYANCMASIGLSYPNLISSFAGFTEDASEELRATWENPLSLTYNQLGHLAKATDLIGITSPDDLPAQEDLNAYLDGGYIDSSYILISNDVEMQQLVLVAKNPLAYFQAGQAICGGYVAVAQNIVSAPASDDEGADYGEAAAMFVVKKILGALPPPYNIIATIILDILTSIDSVNACTSLEDATKMGVLQMKTNRFLNFNQCYYARDTCAGKAFGSCILKRHHHCCYDQISTRIFAEGIKEQLGLDMKECDNITIDHLKEISFVKCTPEQDAYTDHCFPEDKWNEFAEALSASGVTNFDFEGAANQAINSLAIPRNICEVNATNP